MDIQVIYTYSNENHLKTVLNRAGYIFIKVSEMLPNTYLTVLKRNKILDLESDLFTNGDEMIVIGSYKSDGTKYKWIKEEKKKFNHTVSKYRKNLKDILTYDEQGNETDRRRPTKEEAKHTQVNLILGQSNRELEDIE